MSSSYIIAHSPPNPPRQSGLPSILRPPFDRLTEVLSQAKEKVRRGGSIGDEINHARLLLESLPLATEEFGLACNRLANAFRYASSGETGAANWELVTLRKSLSRFE